MTLELVAAALLGLLVLAIVLGPLFGAADAPRDPAADEEGLPPEETRRGQALLAIRDLDFDHATGKLADRDYESLKARFVDEALAVLREEAARPHDEAEALVARRAAELAAPVGGTASCPTCGPRPEADALFCSSCGRSVITASPV